MRSRSLPRTVSARWCAVGEGSRIFADALWKVCSFLPIASEAELDADLRAVLDEAAVPFAHAAVVFQFDRQRHLLGHAPGEPTPSIGLTAVTWKSWAPKRAPSNRSMPVVPA